MRVGGKGKEEHVVVSGVGGGRAENGRGRGRANCGKRRSDY